MLTDDQQSLRERIITMVFGSQADANMDLILSDRIYKWIIGYKNKDKTDETN